MKRIKTPTVTWLTSFTLLAAMFVSPASSLTKPQTTRRAPRSRETPQKDANVHPALSRYAFDLTGLARQGKLSSRNSHKSDLNSVIATLSNDAQHNPVLIADGGADKELAEALARKIAAGKVPDSLQGKTLFSLNLEALAANAKDPAEFVWRLRAVLNETAAAAGQIILFVDQLHQFVGSYAN